MHSLPCTRIAYTSLKGGVKGACFSVPYTFHSVLPFITVLFSSEPFQDETDTRLIEISLSYLRLVSVAIAVTMVRICKRVHAQRSYLFPELLKQRPQNPLCQTHTDLKSVSMPCLSLRLCSCLRSKQGRFFSRFRSCWAFSATHRFIWGTDMCLERYKI